MRTHWSNANDIWEIFIDDPQDPALAEFGFPDEVHGWLRDPGSFVDRFSAVAAISGRRRDVGPMSLPQLSRRLT